MGVAKDTGGHGVRVSESIRGTSLVVQWMGTHQQMQGSMGSIPGPGGFHMPWGN